MATHHAVYLFLIAASGVLSGGLSVVALRNRGRAGSLSLGILLLGVAVWSGGKVLELASPGLSASLFWANLQYVGIVTVVTMWLVFAMTYTGRIKRPSARTASLLTVEPLAVLVAVWTNGRHGLFRSSVELVSYGQLTGVTAAPGPAFWIHAAYSYLLLLVGTVVIVNLLIRSERLYRSRAISLTVAVCSPWLGNALFIGGIAPPALDTTIVGFSLTGVALVVIMARHRLFDIVPAVSEIARDELIRNMTDAVVIVDREGRVVDGNPAAEALLDRDLPGAIGRPLTETFPALAGATADETPDGDGPYRTEFERREGNAVRHYDVRVSPLRQGFGVVTGRLISLRDVTEQRRREQQLEVLNRLLRHNFRNDANVIRGNATLLSDDIEDPRATERLDTIRRTIEGMIERNERFASLTERLDEAGGESTDLSVRLEALIAAKRRHNPHAKIAFDGAEDARVDAGGVVVSAFDELLTNSIEHNDAEPPRVRVSVENETENGTVRIALRDNGPGIPDYEMRPIERGTETALEHGSGVGLWIATWIVREAGGTIGFAETDDGTTVTVRLPVDRSG